MVWESVIDEFGKSIDVNGFYHWDRSFSEFKEKYNLKATRTTPEYLSIDFWSRQRKELRDKGWYILRVGKGSFAVFSEDDFPHPYTQLDYKKAKNLEVSIPAKIPSLIESFKLMMDNKASAEDSILELLRFCDIYGSFISAISGSTSYYVGPRGNFRSSFKMAMKKNTGEIVEFDYVGQIELDYSLWTEDKVFLIEAKSRQRGGMDIGWHKLAFPAPHYMEIAQRHDLDIIPVYLIRKYSKVQDQVFFFVFPPIEYDEPLVLNDKQTMKPENIFKVDLNSILLSGQQRLETY